MNEFENPLRIVLEHSDVFVLIAVVGPRSERLQGQHEAAMLERIAQNVEVGCLRGEGVIWSVCGALRLSNNVER
jgi:hypothetical protein